MKFEELPEEIQNGLLKDAKKKPLHRNIAIFVTFFIITILIALIGHGMWIIALAPAFISVAALIGIFKELKSPSGSFEKQIKSYDYSLRSSESESDSQ